MEFTNELKYYNYNLLSISKIADFNKLIKVKNLNIINQLLLVMKEFIIVKNGTNLYLNYDKIMNNKILYQYSVLSTNNSDSYGNIEEREYTISNNKLEYKVLGTHKADDITGQLP